MELKEMADALFVEDSIKSESLNYITNNIFHKNEPDEEILSDKGAERLLSAYESVDVNNLIYLDSDEDLEKFLTETD